MNGIKAGLATLAMLACPVLAQSAAPGSSVRPVARLAVQDAAPALLRDPVIRPAPRPDGPDFAALAVPVPMLHQPVPFAPSSDDLAANTAGVALGSRAAGRVISLRPGLRPPAVVQKAMAKRRERRRGLVCGDVAIQGEVVGRVPGRIPGCGIEKAVRIRSVAGVSLTQQAVIDCRTARALATWVERAARPAIGERGGGLARLRVAAHYTCRTRNNQRGAKISEHGKGRAIDISGFILHDGSEITVLRGWRGRSANALRRMHGAACGPFGTVLGPEADRHHRDHFHFDTARYRSGSYCR